VKQESFWAWLQHTDNATHFKSNGLGAMAKLKVTLDIMHDKERTSKAKITSPILVAQHLRAIFCNKGCSMEHTDMKINQVVVMYLNDDKISRPAAPPVVSARKGIMSCFFFMFLAVPRHYARRSYSCWCNLGMLACARSRTRIQLLWSKCHGARLCAYQADLLDRRPISCHGIIRDSGSRHKGCRDCGEGARKGQT
jgi:hypothetical protein